MKKVACLTELFLLVTLVPLLSALRWEAIHFSLLRSQILTEVRYLEPGKVALLSEFHFNRKQFKSTRIFVLDLDKETLKEIRCPPNIGSMWNELVGVDFNGNVICRALSKSGGYNYYSCNPKTGEIAFIARRSHNTILNGSRYLCEVFATQESRGFTFVSQSIALVWNDLAELGHAEHKQTLDYPSDYGLKPAVIPRSDSFCFIHRATQIAEKKNSMSGDDSEGKSYSNTIPNPDAPDASLVLMRMTPTGPIEIAKWPVDDKAAFRTADGCIGCLSIDGKTINIHDENTGNVRLKIPNTSYTLNGNSQLNEWEMFGTFTRFNDSFGTSHVYNTTTGAALNLGLYSQGRVLGYQDEELLTLTQGTPVNLEIRNSQNGEVNHSWAIPNREIVAGSNPNENTAFSSDGHEIIFSERFHFRHDRCQYRHHHLQSEGRSQRRG